MSFFLQRMLERQDGVDNLCLMNGPVNDQSVGHQLSMRLDKGLIYTHIAHVLIAVNPYKQLPIYGKDHIKMYQTSKLSDSHPHIFGLAENAYRAMVDNNKPQAVIISGESGAGKTECAKLILHYISSVSGSSTQVSQKMKSIIFQSNPLLESFGNAKTTRNNNSSRFGKYLQLSFNDAGEPVGGTTMSFLLEKTRVTFLQKGERNYHVFYQLLAGGWPELLQTCQLSSAENFSYTGSSGSCYVQGVDDAAAFRETATAMSEVGISGEEQWYIFSTLGAILHLGNVQLQGEAPAKLARGSEHAMEMAAYLLGVDPEDLLKSINHKTVTMGGRRQSIVRVPQNADQATQIRDALAKELYSRIFDLIFARVNSVMDARNLAQMAGSGATQPKFGCTMGILDIFGFEIFENNSFEQMCINYTNEKLQQIFIDLTVRGEQSLYHNEGLPWKPIPFFDNEVVCQLLEGNNPPGVFRLLDDTCRAVHAVDSDTADLKFMEKLQQNLNGHPHLQILRATYNFKAGFKIIHYAGSVTYNVTGFAEKNKDTLFGSVITCLKNSQSPYIKMLFENDEIVNKSPTTSGTKIRQSAAQLVSALRQCEMHYIRCIKPNEDKRPMHMNAKRVIHQIKYLGLCQNIAVYKAGYSYRAPYQQFLTHFEVLMPSKKLTSSGAAGARQLAEYLSKKYSEIKMSEFGFGRTYMFISSPTTVFFMQELREQAIDPVGYAAKVKEHERAEAQAMRVEKKAKKKGCVVM